MFEMKIDTKKGFDVMDSEMKEVIAHFTSYEEADEFRKSHEHYVLRYYAAA